MTSYTFTKATVWPSVLYRAIVDAGLPTPKDISDNKEGANNLSIGFASALDAGQQTTLNGLVAAHTGGGAMYKETHQVETLGSSNRVQRIDWYETDNGDGTFSGLAKSAVYNWSGSRLLSVTTTTYFTNGAVRSVSTETYFTGAGGSKITRRA